MLALLWIANLAGAAESAGRAINWEKSNVTLPPEGGTATALVLEDPQVKHATYAIRGRVRYQHVKGKGYLELLNHFPDGSSYFTRTLNGTGPMQALSGSSDGRAFILPFTVTSGPLPTRLEVNVVLPEGGTVQLEGTAELVQPFDVASASTGPGAWWSAQRSGVVGAVLGTVFGTLGAVLGALAGTKRYRMLLPLALAAIAGCVALLLLSIVALAFKQPYAVWYPLLLTGVVGSLVFGSAYLVLKRCLAEQELRRMSAADIAA